MNISQRKINNEEVLKVTKVFLEKENLGYEDSSYYFEKTDSKIFIYDKKRNAYIIEGEETELLTIYNCMEKIDLDNVFRDLLDFLYFINGTYVYLARKYFYEYIIINKYSNNYDFLENILDRIYILKNNKLINITEEEFKIYYNNVPFSKAMEDIEGDFVIILDENFDFIDFISLSNIKLKGLFKPPYYYFYKGFNNLEVADLMTNFKFNFLKPVPDSNFFYEIVKNKLIIYEYKHSKLEYFSEIKIKETYRRINLSFAENKFKLFFKTRENTEDNLEFYLIKKKNKKLLLVFEYKKNNSHEMVTVNTTDGKKIIFDSKEEDYRYNPYLKNVYFNKDKGIVITDNKEFMYYDGKEIKLIDDYECFTNYNVLENPACLNNGIIINRNTYITYKGEILPIKSFIDSSVLILSVIKAKINKGIYINLKDFEDKYEKDVSYLNATRIDKNIEGYKSKLNKEIIKELIK